jgi:hypothetical protein
MDFIERIFGIAPDGGGGSTEMMIVSGVVLIVIAVMCWRTSVRRTPVTQSSQS